MKNIIEQWQDMTETDQIAMLTACTIKALQIEIPAATLPRFTREHGATSLSAPHGSSSTTVCSPPTSTS